MKPGIQKITSGKRIMRVATVFTGAAAAAAFTPAAMAATGHAAGTGPGTGVRTTALPDGGTGKITFSAYCRNAQWLHLEWSRGATGCFGYSGVWNLGDDKPVSHECGGTNHGYVYYSNSHGAAPYGPGTGYRGFPYKLTEISIQYWTGTDKCGPFPAG
jgi:hypothetical protein